MAGKLREEKVVYYVNGVFAGVGEKTPKLSFTREEVLAALGVDTNDAFNVTILDWGRKGIEFSLHHEARAKYEGK